jgi:hypothetical protein
MRSSESASTGPRISHLTFATRKSLTELGLGSPSKVLTYAAAARGGFRTFAGDCSPKAACPGDRTGPRRVMICDAEQVVPQRSP